MWMISLSLMGEPSLCVIGTSEFSSYTTSGTTTFVGSGCGKGSGNGSSLGTGVVAWSTGVTLSRSLRCQISTVLRMLAT